MFKLPRFFMIVSCLLLASLPVRAAQPDLVLAVSEGTSGGLDHARVIAKYGGLANTLGKALKRQIVVVFAREFSMLEGGIQSGQFDLVIARPSDYPARAVRDNGYQFVASAKPDGQCVVAVQNDSPIKTLADAKGKRWVVPEAVSYMAKFCAAEMRDQGIILSAENVQRVREQGAVPFFLKHKFADIGVMASYAGVAKTLDKTGQRVVHKSVPQPYFPLVAAKHFSAEQVASMQKALTSMAEDDQGREVLNTTGVKGFDASTGDRLRNLLAWLDV